VDSDRNDRTRGDEERFRELFAVGYPALHRYGFLRGLTRADTEDLVAEVLAIAWRRLEAVPVDDPTPWLYAAARNVWRNHLRTEARLEGVVARATDPGVTYPAEVPSSPPLDLIRGAMEALSDDDHEILRLVAWDGLTPAQVAAALGCTSAAARVRLHRARARFARQLAALETPGAQAEPTRLHRERRSKEVPHGQSNAR